MGFIRPATPGFICTLTATILLAVVSFCVPYFKSVYFLKATIASSGVNGTITFGTLGYCLEFSNGTTCSSPSVGYELDINSLVGNKLPIEIPQVAVKWITYALVLHIVALALSAGSAVFGLLAHVREMSMTCCSTFVSGFAAAIALLAFIFDIALFFIAKSRINSIGSAAIGNAIWLTLAAWVLLFFSGCFYTLGRCCISNRKPRSDWDKRKDAPPETPASGDPHGQYAEQMRLDAVKAEADRKAKAQQKEVGLPAFHSNSEMEPLTAVVDGDSVYARPYRDNSAPPTAGAFGGRPTQGGYQGGGYVQAAPGTSAVDEYYNPTRNNATGYPPQPQRQGSGHQAPSVYAPSTYSYSAPNPTTSPPPPLPNNQYLAAGGYNSNAHPGQAYGHTAGGTTYHSAASHQQYPSNYTQYDPYESQSRPEPSYDPYGAVAAHDASPPVPSQGYQSNTTTYFSAASTPGSQPERSYTLGGDGYGASSVPPLPSPSHTPGYMPYPGQTSSSQEPPAINTNVAAVRTGNTSPVKGPRPHRAMSPPQQQQSYDDSPPGYDSGPAAPGAWGKS